MAARQALGRAALGQCPGSALPAAPLLTLPPLRRRQLRRAGAAAASPAAALFPNLLPRRRHTRAHGPVAAAAEADAAPAPADAPADDDPSTAFDWQLGLALAGCAFEAYNELEAEAGSPCLKMTSGGGTRVSFVSQ